MLKPNLTGVLRAVVRDEIHGWRRVTGWMVVLVNMGSGKGLESSREDLRNASILALDDALRLVRLYSAAAQDEQATDEIIACLEEVRLQFETRTKSG